jgi:hypothetical protein
MPAVEIGKDIEEWKIKIRNIFNFYSVARKVQKSE